MLAPSSDFPFYGIINTDQTLPPPPPPPPSSRGVCRLAASRQESRELVGQPADPARCINRKDMTAGRQGKKANIHLLLSNHPYHLNPTMI